MKLAFSDMAYSNAKFAFTFKESIECQKIKLYWEISLIIIITIAIIIIMKHISPTIRERDNAFSYVLYKKEKLVNGNLFNIKKMVDNFLACVPRPEYSTLKMMMCFLLKTLRQ